MKKLRWPLLIALLALVAIAVLLVGQQPELLPVQPVVEPATGGVYAEGLVGSLMRLNPLLDAYNQPDRDVDRLIFSGLVRFDDRGLPLGDLADSWGISRDGTVYNFSLRELAVWHDGEPITSDDVIFTIDMMRDENSLLPDHLRQFWDRVETVRLDEKMLQFRLPEPYSPFLDHLTFGVLPAHLLGDLTFEQMIDDDFNLQPVGSGMYRFDSLIVEDGEIIGVALEAFEDYYGEQPFIEQVAFRYYPGSTSALAAYREGEILGIGEVADDIFMDVLAEPQLNLYTARLPQLTLIFLNHDNPGAAFLQDASVRRALMLGLNRVRIVDRVLGGQAIIAHGPIFPGTWAYYDGIEQLQYNPEAAVDLLRGAGYTIPAEGGAVRADEEGNFLRFELLYPEETGYELIAEAVQNDWARIGVDITLTGLPYDELVTQYLDNRNYEAALVDINLTRSPDPDPYPFWHQAQATGGQNYSKWDDRRASEFLEQARITTDIAERTRLYNNFQVRFAQELPALTLFYPVYNYAVDAEVQGVSVGPLFEPSDRFNTIPQWFLVTRRTLGDESAEGVETSTAQP